MTDRDLLEYMSRLLAEERLLQRQGSNRISGTRLGARVRTVDPA